MDNSVSWKQFQAKLTKNGACTNYAVRQLLIAEFVNQEGAKQAQAALPSSNDITEGLEESTSDHGMFAGICKSMGIQNGEQNLPPRPDQRRGSLNSVQRRGSLNSVQRRGSTNNTQRRGSMNSSTSSWSSFEGDNNNELSIKEISQQQKPSRRTSFAATAAATFSETFNGEKRARRRASVEKLQGFDTIVSNVLDGYEEPSPSPAKGQFHRATKRMSLPSFGVPKARPSIVLGATEGRANSTGDPPSGMEDFRELSAYLATFVDDSDDESDDDGGDKEQRASSPAVEPKEIQTDGKVSRLSIREKDILVDFPTRPRRLSSISGSCKREHGEDPSESLGSTTQYGYEDEVFVKPANWINSDDTDSEDENDAEPSKSFGSRTPDGHEEDVFKKPSNWIDYDDTDSENDEDAAPPGGYEEEAFEKPSNWINYDDTDSEDEEHAQYLETVQRQYEKSASVIDAEDDIDDESAIFKPPAFDNVTEPHSYIIPLTDESSSRHRFAEPGNLAANPKPVRRRSCQSAAEFLESDAVGEFSSPTGKVQVHQERMRRRGSTSMM